MLATTLPITATSALMDLGNSQTNLTGMETECSQECLGEH